MQTYELTIVLAGTATEANKKAVIESINKMIKSGGGKINKTDDWGKKHLFYQIVKNEDGVFLHFLIELKAEGASEMDSKLRMEENIIRYLLVKANPPLHKATAK